MWTRQLATWTALTCMPVAVVAQQPCTLRAEMKKIYDPMAGCDALHLLVPAGWRLDGGIRWRLERATIAHLELRCSDPNSPRQIEFLPLMPFSYSSGCERLYPRGSVAVGLEIQPPCMEVRRFVRDFVVPRCRRGACIVWSEDLPELAQTIARRERDKQGVPVSARAGRVRVEYALDGRLVEEDFYCVLTQYANPSNPQAVIWLTERLYALRAAKGRLDADTKLLQSVALSPRLSLPWHHVYGQVCQQWFRNELHKIQTEAQTTRIIANVNREISDQSRRMWKDWRDARSEATDRFVDALKGIERYRSPYLNDSIEMPAGYRSAWVDGQGRYVLSDQFGFDPHRELPGVWRELTRVER